MSEPSPAPDLFDLPSSRSLAPFTAPPGAFAPARAVSGPQERPGLDLGKLGLRAVVLGVAALALSFPVWWTAAFAGAGVAGELLPRRRTFRRLFWTAVLAAFCAQATSLFVTPFTWPLRAGFFFVLVGAVVVLWAQQIDD